MPEAADLDDDVTAEMVRSGYDAIAEEYLHLATQDDASSHPRRRELRKLLGRLPACSAVVELGCGAGVPVAESIVDGGHRYVGVDISPRQIELARRLVPTGSFIVGDACEQLFDEASFDAALMLYAITHVPRARWLELFRNINGWLKPGGLFLLNTPRDGGGGPGWLEEDFLGFGETNWTNGYGATESLGIAEAAGFVIEYQRASEAEPGGERWHWILAAKQ